ncbi:Syntaxin-8 [Dermatophagoides pteronyssinus]|uniref:Syntaxin-8 n=1 Tax=Dermatophagoides pteronyssinus TaxID=6956 RepID=A0ABQ8J3R3_DERPT|nr:Syntaxin-8 [Dermatophagoides pteronyssinus]
MGSITDEWLKDVESIDEFADQLMHKINQRNQYPTNTPAFAKSDLYIKDLFRKFQRKIGQLQETLNQLATTNKLTQREKERRQRLVDQFNDRCKKIETFLQNPKHSSLLNNYESSSSQQQQQAPIVSWNDGLNVSDSTTNRFENVSKMKEIQQNLFKEQDQNIDSLTNVITRQKYLAREIDSELTVQNEILEDIGEAMDDNTERLLRNTRNIRFVTRESGTCAYWTIIILLLIAILVVSIVPN